MQRVVDARTPEQLDIFVRGSELLEEDLRHFTDRHHYDQDAMTRIASGLAALRHSPVIRETTVDHVLEFVDTTTGLSRGEQEPSPEHAQAMTIGSRAAATVCRFEGLPDGTQQDMYEKSTRQFMWLTANHETSTPRQRAMTAIDVATIFGQKSDISSTYTHIDRYLTTWRNSLPREFTALTPDLAKEAVESVRMLIDLAVKDRTNGSITRLIRAHALPFAVPFEGTEYEPPRARFLLELCLEVGILEKQPKIIPRILKEAKRLGIVPTDDEVVQIIGPHYDNHRKRLFDRIQKVRAAA